jgi:hypothetical protein
VLPSPAPVRLAHLLAACADVPLPPATHTQAGKANMEVILPG